MLETDCLEQPVQHSDIVHKRGVLASHGKLRPNALEMVSAPMPCDVAVWVLI